MGVVIYALVRRNCEPVCAPWRYATRRTATLRATSVILWTGLYGRYARNECNARNARNVRNARSARNARFAVIARSGRYARNERNARNARLSVWIPNFTTLLHWEEMKVIVVFQLSQWKWKSTFVR